MTHADGTTVFYTNRLSRKGYAIPSERVATMQVAIRRFLIFGHMLVAALLLAALFVPRWPMLCFLFVLLPVFWLSKRIWLQRLTQGLSRQP